jgi:hypothetical protein
MARTKQTVTAAQRRYTAGGRAPRVRLAAQARQPRPTGGVKRAHRYRPGEET